MDAEIDRDLLVDLTRALIRFRSVNPPGDEQAVAEYLGGRMSELGLQSEIQPLEPGRANVMGRIKGSGDGHLVFTGHLDVVPPGSQEWEHPPFDAEMADGRIYGRGSCDMKGGVAAIVAAASALIKSGFRPSADLIIAATAGEEAGMVGAQAMVERGSLRGARYLVVAEPSDLDVFVGEKGVLWLKIRALGRTAHGSMPWLGVNAVSFMSRLIPRLEEYPFAYEQSDLLGKPSLSVNVISGGSKVNVVPDVCEIEVDLRTVPSQSNSRLVDAVRQMTDEIAREFHPDLKIEIHVEQDKQSLETDRTEHLVEMMVQTVTAVRGAPRVGGVTYGTDAAALGPGFNIPMVICGPGAQGMAHQPDEYVEVDQLVQAAQIYARVAQSLLG